jgi:FkbM family methyltransferase
MILFIGIPVRSAVHPATDVALRRVRVTLEKQGIPVWTYLEARGSLPLAHSLIAAKFIASEATHLLILHSDVSGFTPEDVLRMMHSGADLIGAPIPGRSFDPERVARALVAGVPPEEAWLHAAPQLWWERTNPRVEQDRIEVAAMSTGFLMMTRKAIDAAARGMTPIRWEAETFCHVFEEDIDPESRQLMSEDKAFCARADAGGVPCWADTRASLVHWGEASFHAAPLASVLVPRYDDRRRIRVSFRAGLACPANCESEARMIWGGAYDLPLEFPPEGSPPVVLDLGANVGAFGRWAVQRWPGAVVDCYEPQGGEVGAALRANVVRGMHVYQSAIVADPAVHEVDFAVRPHQPTGSHVVGAVDESPGEERTRVRAKFAGHLGDADVLKVDIEGHEVPVLRAWFAARAAQPSRLRGVIVEWHTPEARAELRALLEAERFVILDERPLRPDRADIGVIRAVRPAA